MPIENEGSPTNWTVSFKYDHITVLLYAEPLTPFKTLKEELFSTLLERYPQGLPSKPVATDSPLSTTDNLTSHPSSASDIILGKRVNQNKEDEEPEWEEINSKGKETPKSAELKDGSSLAFAYKDKFEENGFLVRRSTFYEDQARDDAEAEAREADEMDEDDIEL